MIENGVNQFYQLQQANKDAEEQALHEAQEMVFSTDLPPEEPTEKKQ